VTLLKKLTHQNVVRLLGWRDTHFNVQLIMPLYDKDLQSYIGLRGMVMGECRIVGACLVEALAYVHGKHIVHRDLKPANILVQCQPLAAVLSDFGAGRVIQPTGVAGSDVAGLSPDVCTRWYASPEILLGARYSFPSDVWSLGVTMVQMEWGIAPFRQSSRVGMMFDILRVLGTPSRAGIAEIAEPQAWHGACGKFVFPHFVPALQKPWGARYGEGFAHYIDDMLRLCPKRRRSALEIQRCSSWHRSGPALRLPHHPADGGHV
jgi:serine/threonine protein kinase